MNTPSASPSSPQPPSTDTTTATAATPLRQPLSKEQRDAIFAKTAATMQPARVPAASELLEWKPQIMEYYAKGFSAAQIRDMLRAGGVVTSERVMQRFVAKYSHRIRRTSASPKRRLSATPAATAATPPASIESPLPAHSAASATTVARPAAAKGSADSVTPKRT